VVIPLKYRVVEDFSEGLALVLSNDKYGFIDKTGREVIPLKFVKATSFKNGIAYVRFNQRWFCIDKNGNEITE
jgi:hypothetical protein